MAPRPRRRVHPLFREAYRIAIYIQKRDALTLALRSGYARQTSLSAAMNRAEVPASPTHIIRLQHLAKLIGYEGPMWEEAGA